jgi:hypothetical protein
MIPALPILHVPLQSNKGAFKPCQWCMGVTARFVEKRPTDPEFHAARVLCEICERQIAWASARACRKAERLAAA